LSEQARNLPKWAQLEKFLNVSFQEEAAIGTAADILLARQTLPANLN
jgi:hypothetical protein